MKRIVIIEDRVYSVTEKQFNAIKSKEASFKDSNDLEYELDLFFQNNVPLYKFLGRVDYQFRI
jgi:hypothetical protein